MRLVLVAVGRLKTGPERELVARYVERIPAAGRKVGVTRFELREIDESRARRAEDRMREEAGALTAIAPANSVLILFDERGRALDSPEFARTIATRRDNAATLVFALGGPDGFDTQLRQRADLVVSFGAMTLPHQLARILVVEQIYRAITILTGHPYHRA